MSPHDLPFGYSPDIANGDVAFYELDAIGNYQHNHFDFEWDEPQQLGSDEEDWESDYPPATPYVPTAEVVAWVDQLIRDMIDRANVLAFGTTDPQEHHYEEFFRQYGRRWTQFRHHHDDDEDQD